VNDLLFLFRSVSLNRPIIGKSKKLSAPSFDDLPEAVRETGATSPNSKRPARWVVVAAIVSLGSLILGIRVLQDSSTPVVTATPSTTASPDSDRVLGHYSYAEAPEKELESVSADGGIRLRMSAARAYKDMVAAAAADGVSIEPLSGFRSIKDQEGVFFEVKQERSQSVTERASVSAPPGHSEHHTGYAIDVGDGNAPATNLNQDFDTTAASKWLETNATKYNFELSFPKNNAQGVSYEPWHWRFVGDRMSLETFFRARGK
jgi:D-alanyl-D-alanine carboxypeptidase